MNEVRGQLRPVGRIGIIVSAYHERITSKLLEGAVRCCHEAGISDAEIDVVWVAGAFELGAISAVMARLEKHAALIALGVVIRGETPHFEFVAGTASEALGRVATDSGLPVGFGLLTVETVDQAVARAGGAAGNKGHEAADAAIRAADVIRQLSSR